MADPAEPSDDGVPTMLAATPDNAVVVTGTARKPRGRRPKAPISDAPARPAEHVYLPTAAVPAKPADEDTTMDDTYTAETAADTMADKGQAMLGDMNDRAKTAMDRGAKAIDEFGQFGRGNVEAMVESSRIAARGVEAMGQDAAEFARRSFENATAVMKTLSQVKSPTEFMKLQGDYVRESIDAMIAQTSRSTEAMLKLAGDVAQPLSSRAAVAADKIKVAA